MCGYLRLHEWVHRRDQFIPGTYWFVATILDQQITSYLTEPYRDSTRKNGVQHINDVIRGWTPSVSSLHFQMCIVGGGGSPTCDSSCLQRAHTDIPPLTNKEHGTRDTCSTARGRPWKGVHGQLHQFHHLCVYKNKTSWYSQGAIIWWELCQDHCAQDGCVWRVI